MLYKHQIQFIADLGYHVAVPCLRGFGHSTQPPHVSDYSTVEIGKDIVGLVRALGHSECIAVAHDWGALHCWHHALLYPEVLKALFIVSIPCWEGSPRVGASSTVDPLAFARQIYPKEEAFWYLRYHNYDYISTVGRPEDEYDADPGLVFRKMIGNPSEAKVPVEQWKWESPAPARAFGAKHPQHTVQKTLGGSHDSPLLWNIRKALSSTRMTRSIGSVSSCTLDSSTRWTTTATSTGTGAISPRIRPCSVAKLSSQLLSSTVARMAARPRTTGVVGSHQQIGMAQTRKCGKMRCVKLFQICRSYCACRRLVIGS